MSHGQLRLGRSIFSFALLAGAWLSCAVGFAQPMGLPGTRLLYVIPAGGQLGTEVDVEVGGADFDDVGSLAFSVPGITATQKTREPELGETGPQPEEGRFHVKIAAEVKPGVYEVRAIGRYGASNPRSFVVSARTEIMEVEPNNAIAKATAVAVDTIVNGLSNSDTDQDFFKFSAKAGQRVLIEAWAYRIDSRMDPTLVVYDAAGRELARNRDAIRRDALIDFTAPAEGDYFIELRDFLYQGDNKQFYYRLTISGDPYVEFVLPPSALAGSSGQFTLYGRNLPGGQAAPQFLVDGKPLESLVVNIQAPADPLVGGADGTSFVETAESAVDSFPYAFASGGRQASPVLIDFAAAPVLLEAEPNNDPEKAQSLALPCDVCGQFYPTNDRDWYQFEAKQGDVWWMEVFSDRLGRATDPFLLVQQVLVDKEGKQTIRDLTAEDEVRVENPPRNFNAYSDDPAYKFVAPANGTFRVMVRNLVGSHNDPRAIYRLTIHAPKPDFRLAAEPRFPQSNPDANAEQATVWNTVMRKGGAERIDVFVFRRDGFDGDVEVAATKLPAGVTCAPIVIGPQQRFGSLVLAASDAAAEGSAPIEVVGKAKLGEADALRVARPAAVVVTGQQNQIASRARMTQTLTAGVCNKEEAPFAIDAGQNVVLEMCRVSTIKAPIKITRRGDFKGAVQLQVTGLPQQGFNPKNLSLDPSAAAGELEIEIRNDAPVGVFSFHLTGLSQVNYARTPEKARAAQDRKVVVDRLVGEMQAAVQKATESKQAAEQVANEKTQNAVNVANTAKTAAQAATDAITAVQTAEAQAKVAGETAAKDPGNNDLQQAKQAADKALEEAKQKAQVAGEAKNAAEKAAAEAAAAATSAAEAKNAAETARKDAEAAHRKAADFQNRYNNEVNQIVGRTNPQSVQFGAASTTLTLKITASPVALTLAAPAVTAMQGSKFEIPVTITRLYDYKEAVQLRLKVPDGTPGILSPPTEIKAEANAGTIAVEATQDAKPGQIKAQVIVVPRRNGQELPVAQDLTLVIEKKN